MPVPPANRDPTFSGFERYLLQKEFPRLRASAHSGPVVILNAAERRCDALIVLADVDHVIHVPLSGFDSSGPHVFRTRWGNCLGILVLHALTTDAAKPTESGLCLADQRRLKLADVIGLSRSRGGLAFLSAFRRRWAMRVSPMRRSIPRQGYGGVIGSMWRISDSLAHVVQFLFRNGTRPDHREAARGVA
ncbi:hypothetical protein JVT61DRAFT_9869 [Boletus reticuloceps]|uniref:Uncharacterized protein n=1 Tax=Boletus reticuloceps TaxID=495285 RepID=A0A8I3A3U7_9AGAM|nr:hypothetical protein JVT61DRAFT_12529 [Boletus reticuloceps]KAG6371244.1 hypothetical protein JVT61DRAFT_9869 [Boletus reticuloceps]